MVSRMPDDRGIGATFVHFADTPWADEQTTGAPADLVAEAQKAGARRKRMVTGDAGFFMNHSVMPAGFEVPPHTHSHDELIVVVEGGCTMMDGGPDLVANDAMVLRAGHRYGFVCGPDGMTFLTMRTGEATTRLGQS
jgi:quercetin dioxygenase-like cupin family protein